MADFDIKLVTDYVSKNISTFHEKRIASLGKLKLSSVLKRKNPYLYKAKNVLTSQDIVKSIVDAHLSSNEETLFGDWLEGLAIYINSEVYGGRKSANPGIDLEFHREGIEYFVAIKSGPNWGNSSQQNKMKADFDRARKVLGTSGGKVHSSFVNGCCYGIDHVPDKGSFQKLCGQRFWELISGDENLYTDIIEPLGEEALARNDEFEKSYSAVINKFTLEFGSKFCKADGSIDWEKLVKFNSGKEKVLKEKVAKKPRSGSRRGKPSIA